MLLYGGRTYTACASLATDKPVSENPNRCARLVIFTSPELLWTVSWKLGGARVRNSLTTVPSRKVAKPVMTAGLENHAMDSAETIVPCFED